MAVSLAVEKLDLTFFGELSFEEEKDLFGALTKRTLLGLESYLVT
jgi:hypothetical protein